ncbi:MAG: MBL fold metallo-hydrolase [Clostridiales bacterium]|jgi:glyoxylase-like metal-dependent hydrolase (beta-lactamase superfamily II)|nr:MBL fold metallo-hydrolase [Clostridiales bacterium]
MKILTIVNSVLAENTYIVYDEATLKGFIVDPGSDGERIESAIGDNGLIVDTVLLTHGHFDHAQSARFFQKKKLKVYIHKADGEKLYSRFNLSRYTGYAFEELHADAELSDGDIVNAAGFDIKTVFTPGHSKGGVCYYLKEHGVLFSGDTLFSDGIGRSDFYDGDFATLKNSIETRLFILDGATAVFPGHDEATTIAKERNNKDLFGV